MLQSSLSLVWERPSVSARPEDKLTGNWEIGQLAGAVVRFALKAYPHSAITALAEHRGKDSDALPYDLRATGGEPLNPEPEHTPLPLNVDPLLPAEMARKAENVGATKAALPALDLLILGILAGAFISLGAAFFTVVTTDSGLGYGVTRFLGGVAFSLGLYLVVVAGAELFTGNNLIVMARASGRISTALLLRNWIIVYAGNLIGALGTVALVFASGHWRFAGHEVGANALRIADAKVNLDLHEAFALGVLCNGLVCLAVWLCYSARSNTDKAVSILFPITAFVAMGLEHSVANMYFIPLGLLLKNEAEVVTTAGLDGAMGNLTVLDFVAGNLLPVTLGNIVGGAVLVGVVYWAVYLRRRA